ncbi:MAG: CaiB/BaiF CoA transferase family protein [Paracoccaceae bacterium]
MSDASTGALAGLRVIEMAGLGPGPLAGQLLADHGAEVIVIDRKSTKPDPADVNHRGKGSLAVNLKTPEGVEIVKKLVGTADVLIEGFRPGVMEKLGLGPQDCHAANPRLIYGRMTGWGQDGPLAHTAGHDLNYLSITGALHAMGPADQPPSPPLNLVADYGGGAMFLLFGILMALYERQSSGKGQVVDTAMSEGVPAMMGLLHSMLAKGLWSPARERNMLDGAAPYYRCYETADGKYLSVGAIEPQFYAELVQLAGMDDTDRATQNDLSLWSARAEDYATLFRTKTRDEWVAIFDGSDACVAPILGWDELETHPQNAARGTFTRVGDVLQAAPAPRFDRTPAPAPVAPGARGASNADVLATLGYSADEIARLQSDGVLT